MSLRHINIPLFFLLSLLLAPSLSQAQQSQVEQQLEVSMRMIGHEVLLSLGDSTSRVLPIEKEEGQYRIQFDTEFEFVPEDLVETINRVIEETELDQSYLLAVEECASEKVVYSYQMDFLDKPDIVPCKSRAQPRACYNLLFTLMDTEEVIDSSASVNALALEGGTSEPSPMKYPLIALALVLMSGMLILFRKKRHQSKPDPNLLNLGAYRFDKRNTELLFDHQKIELSSKEADLLLLLYNAVNTTIEREVILNRVWGDEGDYVGRTLDVFISKLRKKLEADPKVKIVNIRGVGYKLVLNV